MLVIVETVSVFVFVYVYVCVCHKKNDFATDVL